MRKFLPLLTMLALIGVGHAKAADQPVPKILFIGNSYTFVNNLPGVFLGLVNAQGHQLYVDQAVGGGLTLAQHAQRPETISQINAQKWDAVILQEQSQHLDFPTHQLETDTIVGVKTLQGLIRQNNKNAAIFLLVTWARKNGDSDNCSKFPNVCSQKGMQQQIEEGARYVKAHTNIDLIDVGRVWQSAALNPKLNLYQDDGSHPSMQGTYLAACVLDTVLFQDPAATIPLLGQEPEASNLIKQIMEKSL